MLRETINIKLEPEDLELLARVEKETGKSVEQLIIEALRAIYGSYTDGSDTSESDTTLAIAETVLAINILTKKMQIAEETQRLAEETRRQLIYSLSAQRQFYPE